MNKIQIIIDKNTYLNFSLYDVFFFDNINNTMVDRHIITEKLITNPIALKQGLDTNIYIKIK